MAPKYAKRVFECEDGDALKDMGINEYIQYCAECGDWYGCGLAGIVAEVINENEGIGISACVDFDDDSYLIYEPSYPWQLKKHEKEKDLTIKKTEELMEKYLHVLTDEALEFDYQEVHNGG